jgi:hypothetical protein
MVRSTPVLLISMFALLVVVACTPQLPTASFAPSEPARQPAPPAPAARPAGSSSSPSPAQPGAEGFAIYQTADGLSLEQMAVADLGKVRLDDTPLIATSDLRVYLKDRHEIELTPEAYERIGKLGVPTIGKPFVVCVDRRPVYWGAFWTPLSSATFSGVVIQLPLGAAGHTIRIELGYPSPQQFRGQDPRSAPEVLRALAEAGKLE